MRCMGLSRCCHSAVDVCHGTVSAEVRDRERDLDRGSLRSVESFRGVQTETDEMVEVGELSNRLSAYRQLPR